MSAVWVTGGGSGIGRALAAHYYREGRFVVISGRRHDALLDAVRAIAGSDASRLLAIPGDVADPATATTVLSTLALRGQSVEILINNAGLNSSHGFSQTTEAEWIEAFRVNCLGAVHCAQAVLPGMRQRRSGVIVNISSVLGQFASSGSASYSVSKYALTGFTDVLRQDLQGSGIHVLGVYPGFIQTDMTMPFVKPGSLKSHFGHTPEQIARAIARAASQRKAELFYPWYVPWLIRMHRWMPNIADRLAVRLRGEKR